MFLEVAHLGEHQFDFTLVAFLLETGHVFLEGVDFSLEFGLDSLESEKVATFPLVLLGVVVGFPLHLFGLGDAAAGGVD